MALTKIFTGMTQGPEKINDNFNELSGKIGTAPDLGNYYTKTEVDSKLTASDTGWIKVSCINGWGANVSVRLKDGVIYHKGYLVAHGSNAVVFKYPNSFGDMSGLNNKSYADTIWTAFNNNDQPVWGYIEGSTRQFSYMANDGLKVAVCLNTISVSL